ncbi:hypothetical protein ALC60_04018 [Trachymyrmex zeteki]|uniref:DUF3668 domain-containing protein n=1 Tax=Mycetomoellerius zeteki TaxID=64791 RepID=A0A151X9N6_9HYME|nr:hypothetical protein ALC60_04018 [Trachymyrmex zeteki]
MTEATKSDVQIILSIKEGKGFEQVLQPTLLIGTLNGHSLETDRIESCPTPQYITDLVWETNKVMLRRMRSEHVSLKLECFAFKENEGRERLGYILLNIRSAQVMSKCGDLSPKASWHKLLGLQSNLKIQKPELLLALRVEDRKDVTLNPTVELRSLIEKDVILESNKIIPYLHPDEQLIQLGPLDTCCELFILSIMAMYIRNLHLLLPQNPNKHSTVHLSYRVLENDVELKPFETESGKSHFKYPEIESHRNPSGDYGKSSFRNISRETKCTKEYKNVNKQSVDCQCLKHQPESKVTCSRLCNGMLYNINKNHIRDVGSYHCYCLRISLEAISLVSETLSGREIEFRFHHPKTEVMSTANATMPILPNEKVKLQDVVCQFYFISAPNEIKQLLQSFPPKISIYDKNESDELSLLVLDVKPLFCQEKTYKSYRIIKIKIKTLKRKEERHLNMLSEEWRMQKENLESKLAYSVEQCKTLANSLNNATEDLRKRRLKSLENETRLIKANKDLQWRYETKLQELKDLLSATQSDLTSKIAKLEEKKVALEAQMEILSYENENMKSSISKQMDELQMYQKASLTQDQTASLLQEVKILEEKLDNAQKGKEFFREQWSKAVRELHRMKVDYQQAMQVQIKNSREELMSADIAEILSADRKALNNDQLLLKELQKEIDVIKPKQSFTKEIYNQILTPADDICYDIPCNGNKIVDDKSKEYNERLQALKEERDALLRTGNYTDDDVVIQKLNAEIRSLLTSR